MRGVFRSRSSSRLLRAASLTNDWTEAVRRVRPEIPYAVAWPAMRLLEDAGLRDSYREAHPDPVKSPGFTWTPGTPHPMQPPGEGHDRIDYVLAGGRTETISSMIIGEPRGPDVDIAVSPWQRTSIGRR